MDKIKLIKVLSHVINQICEMEEEELKIIEGKIKFRQYQRNKLIDNQLQTIDVTIEA